MSKISELPEIIQQDLLRKLPVHMILEALSDPKRITLEERVCVYYRITDEKRNEFFRTFQPGKHLFEFYYTNMDFLDKNPDDIIKPNTLYLDYFDCLEVLKLHYEMCSRRQDSK